MGYSQGSIYNKALRWVQERPIAATLGGLTEQREPVRLLNAEWTDAVNHALYEAYWNFAMRNVQATPDINRSPQFGYAFSYQKPTDWVRTFQLSDNEQFDPLLRHYLDQNEVWFANTPILYIKYVSKDPNFGWNMGFWTPGFAEYLGGYLALLIAPRIQQALDKVDSIEKRLRRLRAEAIAKDAMDLPVGKVPYDTWVTSRAPRGSILPLGSPGWGSED